MKRNSARLVSEQPLSMEEDVFIRPQRLDEFIGQARVINKLSMFIKAAKARGEPLDHTLFVVLPVWEKPPWLGWLPMRWEENSRLLRDPLFLEQVI